MKLDETFEEIGKEIGGDVKEVHFQFISPVKLTPDEYASPIREDVERVIVYDAGTGPFLYVGRAVLNKRRMDLTRPEVEFTGEFKITLGTLRRVSLSWSHWWKHRVCSNPWNPWEWIRSLTPDWWGVVFTVICMGVGIAAGFVIAEGIRDAVDLLWPLEGGV